MKIVFEELAPGEEEQIVVKCRELNPEMIKLLNKIKSWDSYIIGHIGTGAHRLSPNEISYVDTVDRKVFIYCDTNVYESKKKLYELEETLAMHDFARISKSTLVNLRKIKAIVPSYSGRMEAVLHSGEKLVCSRQYITELKSHLGV